MMKKYLFTVLIVLDQVRAWNMHETLVDILAHLGKRIATYYLLLRNLEPAK
jgi:hypothetical protein